MTAPAGRVVSLTCSNTEIVCALGCADRLVGVDDHSDFPAPVVAGLPRVGPDLGIDIERVAALQPDLVLASLTVPGHETVVAGLEAAGLPYLAPEPASLADVYRDVRDIGLHLGVPQRGDELARAMEAAIGPPAPTGEDLPAILIEWWPRPVIAAGGRSWVTGLLAAAGGRNPLADRPVKSASLADEEVRALAPDALVISWCGAPAEKYRPEVVARRAGWHEVPAVRDRRVFCVAEAFLGRPGPRLVDGHRALARIVKQCRKAPLA